MGERRRVVDLRSDTVTKPTQGMRAAMAAAEVGDDVLREDPTVRALEERLAGRLGKEAGLFVPSGTMANLIALMVLGRPGDTVILHEDAHPYRFEAGGCARIAGLLTRTLGGEGGILDPDDVGRAIKDGADVHISPTTIVAIENTMNMGGGRVYEVERVEVLGALARARGLRLHCDGARLFNAAVALGRPAADLVGPCDTVSVCLSKGLGCPVGSVLLGSEAAIEEARRVRKVLGGGMRQAGVVAAAGLYALEHHVGRLAEDHRRAERFRRAVSEVLGADRVWDAPTNIVMVEVAEAADLARRLAGAGVLCYALGPRLVRFVFHLDVDDEATSYAIDAFRSMVQPVQ